MTEEIFEFAEDKVTAYSPLDDFDAEEAAEEVESSDGQMGPATHITRPAYRDAVKDTRPAPERIESLFERLEPRKRVLRNIMNFLDTPKRSDVLSEKVVELQEYDFSVFDGYSYSSLLFEAGAIDKVMEDGSPIPEDYEQAPDIVVIDGVEYYKPTNGIMVYWVTTEDGKAYLAKDDPEARMQALLQDELVYAHIYQRVLDAAAMPTGAAAQTLADLVDNDPVCQTPRRWSAFFSRRLEDCDAITFAGTWKITEIGKKAQVILAQIIADKEGE